VPSTLISIVMETTTDAVGRCMQRWDFKAKGEVAFIRNLGACVVACTDLSEKDGVEVEFSTGR
jgi:hypothetical protein